MFIFFHNSSKLLVSYFVSLLVPESAIICRYIAMNNLIRTYSCTLIFFSIQFTLQMLTSYTASTYIHNLSKYQLTYSQI